jgi:hypothetical protein
VRLPLGKRKKEAEDKKSVYMKSESELSFLASKDEENSNTQSSDPEFVKPHPPSSTDNPNHLRSSDKEHFKRSNKDQNRKSTRELTAQFERHSTTDSSAPAPPVTKPKIKIERPISEQPKNESHSYSRTISDPMTTSQPLMSQSSFQRQDSNRKSKSIGQ